MQKNIQAASILAEVAKKAELLQANTILHLHAQSTDGMKQYELEIAKTEEEMTALLDTYQNICQNQNELDKLTEFRLAWSAYSQIRDEQLLPASRTNHKEEALAIASENGPGSIAAQRALDKLKDLQKANSATAEERIEQANQEHHRSQNFLRLGSLLAIVPALAVGVYLSSQISEAMKLVSNAAQLLASGDFDWSVTVKTGDEIESVAESCNRIGRQMKKALAARREAAEQWQRTARERKQIETMLAAEKERLTMTLHLINDGVILTDTEGNITFINQVAEKLTGWTQDKGRGRPIDEVFSAFDVETHNRCANPIQQVWDIGRMVDSPHKALLKARDGKEQVIIYRSAPVYGPEGSIVGAVLSFRGCWEANENGRGTPRLLERDVVGWSHS